MNSAAQFNPASDRLLVGFCGVPLELLAALNLCRVYAGTVLFREKDVLVIEFTAASETIDELLRRLPRCAVTHLCRTTAAGVPSPATRLIPFLAPLNETPKNAKLCVCNRCRDADPGSGPRALSPP